MWNWYDSFIHHHQYCALLLSVQQFYLFIVAGQATEQLKPFQEVIGIDPSSVMLDKARSSIARSLKASTTKTKFQFVQGSAEELSQTTLQPESVDLITAGMTFEIESHYST